MENFEPIDINFIINDKEVAKASLDVKNSISGAAQTAEKSVSQANEKINQAFKKQNEESKKHATLLKTVSDKYRGVLKDGLLTFDGLSKKEQTLVIQYHNTKEAIESVNLAQKELNNSFEDGKVTAVAYTQAKAALGVEESKLKGEIKEVEKALISSNASLAKQGRMVQSQKPKWNGLNNSINQLSRELPAFTYSAQTGLMAVSNNIPILADEINRLKEEIRGLWGKLQNLPH